MSQVETYFKRYANSGFMQGRQREEQFLESLTPEQRKVYSKALSEKEIIASRFLEMDKAGVKEIKQQEAGMTSSKSVLPSSFTGKGRRTSLLKTIK